MLGSKHCLRKLMMNLQIHFANYIQTLLLGQVKVTGGNYWLQIRIRHLQKNYRKLSRKESSFLAKVPLIKLIGETNLQSPLTAREFLPQYHRDTRLGWALTNALIVGQRTTGDSYSHKFFVISVLIGQFTVTKII